MRVVTLGAWLRPPRHLLILFGVVIGVSTAALAWASWQILAQDRALAARRAAEARETAATAAVGALQQRLAELEASLDLVARAGATKLTAAAAEVGERLPPSAVLVVGEGATLEAHPHGRLLYHPAPPPDTAVPAARFAAAHRAEVVDGDPAGAVTLLSPLTRDADRAIRANALLRLARSLRKMGRTADARRSYEALAAYPDIRIGGVPTDLAAARALCGLDQPHATAPPCDARALDRDLETGRWLLSRAVFDACHADLARGLHADEDADPAADRDALSEALHALAVDGRWGPARQSVDTPQGGALVLTREMPNRRAMLVALPHFVAGLLDSTARSHAGVTLGLVDGAGRAVVGPERTPREAVAAIRPMTVTGLPWTVHAFEAVTVAPSQAWFTPRGRVIATALSAIVLLIIGGSYLIGRAVVREHQVARLQSDFVSAVSHEFRTPLTALRQMSELLVHGRIDSGDLRQRYYRAIQQESHRLARLVEGLLKFGRMQAGVLRYAFEPVDAAALVSAVVEEFRLEADRRNFQIDLTSPATAVPIRADQEAMSCAIWNLLDNAVKYSPDCATVWVSVEARDAHVAIAVRDRGIGVAVADRDRIFGKFVRGRETAGLGVQGSGIGLAIAREIVEAHGGTLALESEPGAGSTFTIRLPGGPSIEARPPAGRS
jgi:signal transduction histidine kinase